MRAIRVHRTGGPETLVLDEVPDPEPGPGEVVVAVEAAGVNFIDVYHRRGLYPLPLPTGIGVEGAGTVLAVGPDPAADGEPAGDPGGTGPARRDGGRPEPGDRVGWIGPIGAYAERAVVPADRVVALPDDVPSVLAAAVLLQGMTAHALVHDVRPLVPGDVVLVWAAAGGTGGLIVQLARAAGARVVGVVSTPDKGAEATRLGAEEALVAPAEGEVEAVIRRLSDGRGAAVVYDSVGAASFPTSLAACARRGMLVAFGQSSGPVPPFDVRELSQRGSLFLTRPMVFDYVAERADLEARAAAVLGLVATGALEVRLSATLALAEAAEAHRALESRATAGKLVLVP